MSYTNAYFKNDELDFPHPPLFLVWTGTESWDQSEYQKKNNPEQSAARKGRGKIRHVDSLDKAKKRVSGYACTPRNLDYMNSQGRAEYRTAHPHDTKTKQVDWEVGQWVDDWAIYEWVADEYVLRYEGKRGDLKPTNPLFKKLVKKGTGRKARTVPQKAIEAAKASILEDLAS